MSNDENKSSPTKEYSCTLNTCTETTTVSHNPKSSVTRRRRSRSPKSRVLIRIRSSSLGRTISNLRGARRGGSEGRPLSGDPCVGITSSTEDTPLVKTEARKASPSGRKLFNKSEQKGTNKPDVKSSHRMFRSVKQQFLQIRSKSNMAKSDKNVAPSGTVIERNKSTVVVEDWLEHNPVANPKPTEAKSSQEVIAEVVEACVDEDGRNITNFVKDLVEETEDLSDAEQDQAGMTEQADDTTAKQMTERNSDLVNDDDSIWTDNSVCTEMLERPMKLLSKKDANFPKAIQVWEINIHLISGTQLVIRDSTGVTKRMKSRLGTSDPYVKFKYNGKVLDKSKIVRRSLNPIWDEFFCFYLDDIKRPLELRVYDYDKLSDDYMGRAFIDLKTMEPDSNTELTMELEDETGKSKEKFMGTLRVACKVSSMLFDPAETMSSTSTKAQSPTKNMKMVHLKKNALDKRMKGIKSAIDTGRTRFKPNWIATVTITLIEGKDLLAMDSNGLSDPFVKFRLGNEKYRSKVVKLTLNPRWLEQFDLRLSEEGAEGGTGRMLEITVWDHDDIGRNDFMGRTSVDLSKLRREHTHLVEQNLEDGAGLLRLLITISGTFEPDSVTDLRNYSVSEVDRQRLVAKFNFFNTFKNMRDVGWLQVKVLKAEGLEASGWSGRCDPFCVIELVNSRLQTHTEYKTCDPEWNKVFVFNVRDIHSVLEVVIYNEDQSKKAEVLGSVMIPLLRIRNGEKRWYALKDRKMTRRGKGAILLEMDMIYNQFRAAWRTVNTKENKYAVPYPKFKLAVMRRHIDRISRIIDSFIFMSQFIESCWSWESPARSILAFISFMIIVWCFEPYMLPLTLVIIFSKEYIYTTILNTIYRKNRVEDFRRDELVVPSISSSSRDAHQTFEEEHNYATSTDDDDDKSDKEDRRSIKEKIQSVQETMLNVQEHLGSVASFCERIHNSFTWTVPWLSRFAVIVLIIATIVLYLVPLRWLIMLWGINKFTKKLIRPNFIDNNELFDFISRVPSDLQMLQYKEMKPDFSTTQDSKKR